ncbi:transferrin receptor ectodomain, apical domain-containing protein [Calocera cornea HHB12733]|uniref:RING-type E3 ubiquitin transferase n=1 Tax=Calocera cornea HHB12733 TaxID=1353952 RepID=A0A165JG66_9BASI|nr:transferrin receptor ectodomain, apical domain-containing protein [Calocera cornea HHB12733]
MMPAVDGSGAGAGHGARVSFSSRPAAFGLRIVNAPGLSGHLIPMSQLLPHCPSAASSCPPLCPHYPFPHLENEGWIALIQRGECSFVEKVREAQRLGAVGVVVGGREKGRDDELITMYSPADATDIGIPSCYVTYDSYAGLMKLWDKSNNTTPSGYKALDLLLGEDEAWQWPVFTFSLLLLLPSILTLLTLVVHRIRQQRAEVRERAPEDIVHSLPTRVWNGSHWDKDEAIHNAENGEARPKTPTVEIGRHKMHWAWFETQVECAICLSAFERGDRVRVLPCGHVFHIDEIDGWLVKQKKLVSLLATLMNPYLMICPVPYLQDRRYPTSCDSSHLAQQHPRLPACCCAR